MKRRALFPLVAAALLLGSPADLHAQTARAADAPAPAQRGLPAKLRAGDGDFRVFHLLKKEKGQLFYAPPNTPEGVMASIPLGTVQELEFNLGYDTRAVARAARQRQYAAAADLILAGLRPVLPFVDVAPNNAADPLYEAADYLLKQALVEKRAGREKPAAALHGKAQAHFQALAALGWFERAGRAELLMVQCLLELGQLEQAEAVLDQASLPDETEPEAGLYWLTQARLRYGLQRLHEALDAAVKSAVCESKDVNTFPDALLLSARCYEDLLDFHRARDVYFEVARLFMNSPWGDFARQRLEFVMTSGLTKEKEEANITKLFFETEEDMDQLAQDFLERTRQPVPEAEPSPNVPNPPPPDGEVKHDP